MFSLEFAPALIARTPFFCYTDYSLQKFEGLLREPIFRTALYIANRQLFHVLERKEFSVLALSAKERLTLCKYINRMHFRPTPMGLFATYSVLKWSANATRIKLQNSSDRPSFIDWDFGLLVQLTESMINSVTAHDRLHLNPTLYQVHEEYRFIATGFDFDKQRICYSLQSVIDPFLETMIKILTDQPTFAEAVHAAAEMAPCEPAVAVEYITSLVEQQVLKTEKFPNSLGKPFSQRLPVRPLNSDKSEFLAVRPCYNSPTLQAFLKSEASLGEKLHAGGNVLPNSLYYINQKRKVESGGVHISYQGKLKKVLSWLSARLPETKPAGITRFMEEFIARYDQQEVPLLYLLDPETGIRYDDNIVSHYSPPLLSNVEFECQSKSNLSLPWSSLHAELLKHWPGSDDDFTIKLPEPPDDEIAVTDNNVLPPSIAVMFRVVQEGILLESAGGATGVALLGRFAHMDEDVKRVVQDVVNIEQQNNPEIIFADLAHLVGLHAENVNLRPSVYDYEIVISSSSSLPVERQIPVSDLMLSITQGQIILRSRRLGRRVIPRLSSAYNYRHNDLAIFRFLCDVQHAGIQSNLTFNLQDFFPGLEQYPCVEVGGVIISTAKWYLKAADISTLFANGEKGAENRFELLRQRKRLPQTVALTHGDQQLVFDLNKTDEIALLLECIKNKQEILLEKYSMPNCNVLLNPQGKPLVNQFIAIMRNVRPSYDTKPAERLNEGPINKSFPLGSQWIYLKIYCNERIADEILPGLPDFFYQLGLKQKWFFIRYHDPQPHIRLRVKVEDDQVGVVLKKLRGHLDAYFLSGQVKDYQSAIYKPELERYGPDLINEVEAFFNCSSRLICSFFWGERNDIHQIPAHQLAFFSVRNMIELFLPDRQQQINFTEQMKLHFFAEFGAAKKLRISLDRKFRHMQQELNDIFIGHDFYHRCKIEGQFHDFVLALKRIEERLYVNGHQRMLQLLGDLIHMHINRIFNSNQREQEFCIYFLFNKYLHMTQKKRQCLVSK